MNLLDESVWCHFNNMTIFAGRNFFPKHQAALIVPTDAETAPAQISTGTLPSVQSVSPMLGTLSAGNQFSSTSGHLQSNALVSQNAYPTGRMTPQAMQQGIKIFAWTTCLKVRLELNAPFPSVSDLSRKHCSGWHDNK